METIGLDKNNALGTVESKIRFIVESMSEEVEYMFANWAQANVSLDNVRKPTIVYVLPPSGSIDILGKM